MSEAALVLLAHDFTILFNVGLLSVCLLYQCITGDHVLQATPASDPPTMTAHIWRYVLSWQYRKSKIELQTRACTQTIGLLRPEVPMQRVSSAERFLSLNECRVWVLLRFKDRMVQVMVHKSLRAQAKHEANVGFSCCQMNIAARHVCKNNYFIGCLLNWQLAAKMVPAIYGH